MEHKKASAGHTLEAECTRTRLAQNSTMAVDVCTECGMLHLHVGPITLRLAPCAVTELIATLQTAMEKRREQPRRESGLFEVPGVRRRGQA